MRHFTSAPFKFMNFKFLDLHNSIPDAEKEDFFIYEKFNSQNYKLSQQAYLIFMEHLFGQKPSDTERARKRYEIVVAVSRTYQVIAYSIFFWICYKILNFFMNKIY